MTFLEIFDEVNASTWQPGFEWKRTSKESSESINIPHEDYPLLVGPTIDMIEGFVGDRRFTWADACNIQKFLQTARLDLIKNDPEKYSDLPNQHINLGLRKIEVKVGKWTPPHPMFLQELVDKIFPVFLTDMPFTHDRQKQISSNKELIEWYKLFQTIHPFEDLNGRVGGIIVAVLSHSNGQFLTPKREQSI